MKNAHKKCNRGYIGSYVTRDLARAACSADPECTMFYDDEGKGLSFELCSHDSEVEDANDSTILYTNQGKLFAHLLNI